MKPDVYLLNVIVLLGNIRLIKTGVRQYWADVQILILPGQQRIFIFQSIILFRNQTHY